VAVEESRWGIRLYPLGLDVSDAQSGGQMYGGVRAVWRTRQQLVEGWVRVS
jgi:hypothetical protein